MGPERPREAHRVSEGKREQEGVRGSKESKASESD